MVDTLVHYPAVLWCARCGRLLPANRGAVLSYVRSGLPACCGLEMDLFILAERPKPDDTQVVAIPLTLPGSDEGTDVIPVPKPRKPAG
jgi:hypothetical protein